MTLPAPHLDDRSFQELVDEAKRRITDHCPEWTNHNVSDPGVALIELFAYMTEQTLFRLNQVPDRMYTQFLNMVGIEPFPARSARTLLTFGIAPRAEEVRIPASTEVATRSDAAGQVIFVTDDELLLAQPRLTGALTADRDNVLTDRWDDLRFEHSTVTCFERLAVGDTFMLGFADSMARHVVRLSLHASAQGLGIDPASPPIKWEASTDAGWAPIEVIADETGGLNRDGRIDLAIPMHHDALTLDGVAAHWIRVTLADTERGQKGYGASPQLRSLHAETIGGQVFAHHGEPVGTEVIGVSDGTPGQRMRVQRAPVLPRRPDEVVRVVSATGSHEWVEVDTFGASGSDSRHVVWHDATGEIEFGPRVRDELGTDYQRGAVPPSGAQITVTSYRVGGGSRGNVGEGTLRVLRTTIPFVDRVINRGPASGGADAETVAAAKQRAPLTLRTGRRAVTASDFARLALESTGEVARTRCLDSRNGDGRVRLLIVPAVGGDLADHDIDDFGLDETLYMTVRDYLEPRRVIGTKIEIGTPYYVGVSIAVLVRAAMDVDRDAVEMRVSDALHRLTHPIVGGPDQTGVPFGWTITVDDVRQMLIVIPGVVAVEDVALFGADLRSRQRVGAAVDHLSCDSDVLFLGFQHKVVVR